MQFRFRAASSLLVAYAALAGCSGGSSGTTNVVAFACSDTNAKALCLNSCSLGCSSTGCLRTDIAQNENLVLYFSKDVDPASVTTSSIQLRTPTGELPIGEFFVNGSRVEFVPTLLVSGGQTFFGFKPGETYTMTLPGGPTQPVTVRSTSGEPFEATLSCTLVANQGIVDHNGVPPSVILVSPTSGQLGAAPLATIIQLEFSEMVDATPFLAATGGNGPVTLSVRRTRAVGTGTARECDTGSVPVVLGGTSRLDFDPARGISVLTFRTNQDLSPNTCIEINVTVDGVPVVFSDSTTISTMQAGIGSAVRAYFQNANLDLTTGLPAPLTGEVHPTIRPWRSAVLSTGNVTGIASDGLNGFRFALVVDHAIATTVTIDKVKVVYRV